MALGSIELQSQPVAIAIVAVLFLLVRYLNKTDVPKIKNLPEIPGVPIFGNLIQLDDEHARRARQWVKKYGEVFQVRMGNKVCLSLIMRSPTLISNEGWIRESSSQTPSTRSGTSGSRINPV
jgi:phenylacetate 2-hydroxylase